MPLAMMAFIGFLITASPYALLTFWPAGKSAVLAKAAPAAWLIATGWEIIAAALGWNIRVDLLLIVPVLLLLSFGACIVWIFARRRPN